MKRDTILKLAASTMVISTTLTGCGPFGGGSVASVSSKPATVKDGEKYAKKAEKAMAKGKIQDAIVYAERSVAGVGNDPETRALLGQSYLAAGRFYSAERSFLDAMELGKNDARTVLSLSLAQLGQGKANKAKQLIETNRQFIPTADYGLALALTGDSKAAIAILENAIRSNNVTGRTRQNLGLAYALDGRWKEAKLMAMQDMTPATLDNRMMQWAQMARPGAYDVRVASLLNVKPIANDPGQPVRLALNAAPAMPVVAEATPAQDYSREVASFDRDIPLPAVGAAPAADSEVDFMAKENNVTVTKVAIPASKPAEKAKAVKPVPAAPEKTFIVESSDAPAPAAKAVPATTAAEQVIAAVKPVLQKVAFTPRARSISNGKHLVQLGVFSSPENVKRAWGILSSQNKDLASFQYASSTIQRNGKTLYRLAAMGFGNEQSAKDMCSGIKSKGGACIVRNVEKVRPTQMAAR
ncbi:SPOR domain-containing protein [Parasphingorhabdus cellanae]|uniref:SPOR domain-containing protein n=1 Tax=Parasphingorhabdus cellanae TaxID=2806553 RepID=A0ABX7T460_9SPHN|nr:SPOR domain-containing protein [Parasphingorhabdus cellanae]QTD56365.1 SPOR domain-containing protein [Parasphingorhabdus cellanae]